VFTAVRDLPRLREISSVLNLHGLGDLVRRTGTATLLERAGQILQWREAGDVAHLEPQQRVRLAFEEPGPTFVKLGQMLSTREDILPPAWTAEPARLHSDVPPAPFDELLPQVEQALGSSPFEVFGDLERAPYAAASIAQVHRAKLASGTRVILKVRRPGIVAKSTPISGSSGTLLVWSSAKCRRRGATGPSKWWISCAARSGANSIWQLRPATWSVLGATSPTIPTSSYPKCMGPGRAA
jgi:hypothetical protein